MNQNGAQMGDLFMSLIHTCELKGADPVRLSEPVAATRRGVEASAVGADALELSRDVGADRRPPECGVGYAGATLRNGRQTGHLRRQNRRGFLARHGNRRKCSAPAFTPASLRTTNRPSRCRSAPCGNTPSGGGTIALQVKEVRS